MDELTPNNVDTHGEHSYSPSVKDEAPDIIVRIRRALHDVVKSGAQPRSIHLTPDDWNQLGHCVEVIHASRRIGQPLGSIFGVVIEDATSERSFVTAGDYVF